MLRVAKILVSSVRLLSLSVAACGDDESDKDDGVKTDVLGGGIKADALTSAGREATTPAKK